MRYIRLTHPRHYDAEKGRFSSEAFRCSSADRGGGASVIACDCVETHGRGFCEHIRQFYASSVSGEPAIFFVFAASELPPGHRIEQQTTASGDTCHHNVHGVKDKALRQIVLSRQLRDFNICATGGIRPLLPADLEGPPRMARGD